MNKYWCRLDLQNRLLLQPLSTKRQQLKNSLNSVGFSTIKFIKAERLLELSRDEPPTDKKILLISVLRSVGSESFLQEERKYYDSLRAYLYEIIKQRYGEVEA